MLYSQIGGMTLLNSADFFTQHQKTFITVR